MGLGIETYNLRKNFGDFKGIEIAKKCGFNNFDYSFFCDERRWLLSDDYLDYDINSMPEVTKDYDIVAIFSDGSQKIVKKIRGNYQRFNKIKVNVKDAVSIKFNFINTNGEKNIRIYNISIY